MLDAAKAAAHPAIAESLILKQRDEISALENRLQLSKCPCTFAQRLVGDGCRYCNPQEYIDRLHERIKELEKELPCNE